jgi:hypothetical protein
MKETIILVLKVSSIGKNREDLESIKGMDFNSIQAIRDAIEDVNCFRLTDFMDACNDDIINAHDISENWIGYVNLITEI